MKALTVQQPWAWAIIHGGKDVENRTQLWKHRGPVVIHAGLRYSHRGFDVINRLCGLNLPPWNVGHDSETTGTIIGVVDLVDAHHAEAGCCESPWAETSYVEHGGRVRHEIVHLVLEHPRPVTPVVARGSLGLWDLRDDLIVEAT